VDVTRFEGFPAGAEGTVLPKVFFTEALPLIDDAAELAVSAYAFYAIGQRRRFPRHVTLSELAREEPLLRSLARLGGDRYEALRAGLLRASARGTLLHVEVERDGRPDHLYLVNTPAGRRDAARIRAGLIPLGVPTRAPSAPANSEPPPSIFRLYEDTFGTLSPAVARELDLVADEYPADWVQRAFRQAAVNGAKSWSYVRAILKRWHDEGVRNEETGRRDSEVDLRERYTSGRYGQFVD
jgi:DnaD/phage-associated family protein